MNKFKNLPKEHLQLLSIIFLTILVGAYFALALLFNLPPFKRQLSEPPSLLESLTYRSDNSDFEFQYPQQWHYKECVSEDGYLLSFGEKQPLLFCESDAPVQGYFNVDVTSKKVELESDAQNFVSGLVNGKITETIVDGVPAKRVEGTIPEGQEFGPHPGAKVIYVISHLYNKRYTFFYIQYDEIDYSDRFNDTLATFKFL